MRCGSYTDPVIRLRTGNGRAWALAAGDAVALMVFAAIGRRSHDEAAGIAAALALVGTAAPFVAGWLIAAWPLGAFRDGGTATAGEMARTTLVAWTAAFPIAAAIRAVALWHVSPWTFYVVAYLFSLLMLTAWRTAFVLGERRWARRAGTGGAA